MKQPIAKISNTLTQPQFVLQLLYITIKTQYTMGFWQCVERASNGNNRVSTNGTIKPLQKHHYAQQLMGPKRQKGQKCEFLPTDPRSHMWPLGRNHNFIILLYNPYQRIILYNPQNTKKQKERCFLQKPKPLPSNCLSVINKEKQKKKKKCLPSLCITT